MEKLRFEGPVIRSYDYAVTKNILGYCKKEGGDCDKQCADLRGVGSGSFVHDGDRGLLHEGRSLGALREKAVVRGRGILGVLQGWRARWLLRESKLGRNPVVEERRPALEVHPYH